MENKPIAPHIGQVVGYVDRRTDADKCWYLGYCIGKSDKHAADTLRNARIEEYYPLIREFRDVPKRELTPKQRNSGIVIKRPRLVPLLPRYRLLHLDIGRPNLHEILDLAGIGGLVCHGDFPIGVPDSFVAQLRGRETDGAIPGATSMRVVFEIGEEVRVLDGPFASFNGIVESVIDVPIEELDPETRIKVAVNIFGRSTPVELAITQVHKL